MFFSLCRVFNRLPSAVPIALQNAFRMGNRGSVCKMVKLRWKQKKEGANLPFYILYFEVPGRFEPPYAVLQTAT